ncbi:2-succinyl-6-hydroxy-2,4-cyclohexadiene-1-carboxylate synthase [Candidatus Tiddalikarchaeum anstoanum]|nr:2-succinyl-6-hydroxy-2,4-cyclohexadiene-1-carboxylate synthase [Candidatus Tiddalikarchaeum anstoanum]
MEKITIKNGYGEKLAGNLYYHYNSDTLFIISHGFMGSKNSRFMSNLSENLYNGLGVSVFAFDFSGNGESEGVFGNAGILKEKDDLCSVINFFRNFKNIILVGHSMGAAVSLLSANCYKNIKGLVLHSGLVFPLLSFKSSILKLNPIVVISKRRDDFLKDLNNYEKSVKNFFVKRLVDNTNHAIRRILKKTTLNKSFFEEATKVDLINKVKSVHKPLLIIHGSRDEIIPKNHAEYLFRHANNPKKMVILNSIHEPILIKDIKEASDEVIKWYKKTF